MKVSMMVMVISLIVSACSFNKTAPAIDVYTLLPTHQQQLKPQLPADSISIQLAKIDSSAAFKSNKIIYRHQSHGFDSYAHSRWSDSAIDILLRYFQQFLQQSGYFSVVISENSLSTADWIVETNLYDFSHHITDADHSRVQLVAQFYILDSQHNNIIATTELTAEVAVAEQNAKAAVEAFQQAVDSVSLQLSAWLIKNLTN